jgi:hypothetical protein
LSILSPPFFLSKYTQIFPNLKQSPDFVIIPSNKEIIIIHFVSSGPHYGSFICAFLLSFSLVFHPAGRFKRHSFFVCVL